MTGLSYLLKSEITSEEDAILQKGLGEHSKQTGNLPADHEANILCYDNEKMIAGITSQITGSRLHIKLLWVHENYRGKNIGRHLMQEVEKAAQQDNCKFAFVNTLSFQGPAFYEKLGYQEVARINEFYEGHDRVFYRKEL